VDTSQKGPVTGPQIAEFDLRIAPSRHDQGATGSVTMSCPSGSGTAPVPDAFWTNYMMLNAYLEDGGQRFVGWTVTGREPYATKQVSVTMPVGGTLSTLELWHRPK
jgi:hypothetical protein